MKQLVILASSLLSFFTLTAQNEKETMLRSLEIADTLKVSDTLSTNHRKPNMVVNVEKTIKVADGDTVEETTSDTLVVDSNTGDNNVAYQGDTIIVDRNQGNTKSDSTIIRLGEKTIVIVEGKDKTTVEIPEGLNKDFRNSFRRSNRLKFKGHWAGIEMGVNGFMDADHSTSMSNELEWLDLKQSRSWNVNLNFLQYSMGFGTSWIGLVTGMGLEFNDYHFNNPLTLRVVNGVTVADSSYLLAGYKVDKTKLSTVNLTLPLLVEFQIPTSESDRHKIYISAGVIGGLRIGTHTKVVFDDGDRHKDKGRSDFNIATFRYGVTARAGYRSLRLFANYYPTQLFEKNKGPEIYPFAVGLVLIPF